VGSFATPLARRALALRVRSDASHPLRLQVGPKQFERVLDMVSKVRSMGMEVCTTLGMLTKEQADQLKVAGLSCYNHNLDTSPEFYPKITSSRNYDDRLDTLKSVTDQPTDQKTTDRLTIQLSN